MLTLTGCTSIRTVDHEAPYPYAEVNAHTQDRVAQVRLIDGYTIRAVDLQVASDSASYFGGPSGAHAIATQSIEVVELTQRGQGALQGIGIGLLAGGGGGALIGLMSGTTCGANDWFCGPGFNAAVFGTLFGAVGGAIGLVVGTAQGCRVVYRFTDDQAQVSETSSDISHRSRDSGGRR